VKVTVDQDKCCGAGNCVRLVPAVFDQREDDGIVTLLDSGPDPQLHDAVRGAADVCPCGAISVHQ
jgi:ferredoxin